MKKKIIKTILCLTVGFCMVFTNLCLPGALNAQAKKDNPKESMNIFPADTGPVPHKAGTDKRPHEQTQQAVITPPSGTLVLYDTTGSWGYLGELYGIASVNLSTHFGSVSNKPVKDYIAGDLNNYQSVIYIGSTYDEPLPAAFLDDVLQTTTTQVVWMYNNIWKLKERSATSMAFLEKFGFDPYVYDYSSITTVSYKGVSLSRDSLNQGGIMSYSTIDPAKATVLAEARKADGTTIPWAIRSGKLTYIGEIPFAYISANDRYLAFCDMLYDVMSPSAAARHRALVRLEDVSPNTDPVQFKALVDYLYGARIPFSFALIPVYTDPNGYYNNGVPETVKWKDSPKMQTAVKYALSHGGTIVMHGYTHQYDKLNNPYSGVSSDDFEFYMSHIDANDYVIYDGAVPGDSASWALGRINSGLGEIKKAGFTAPMIFEYPHYAGSPTDSKAIAGKFKKAYHRGIYFSGGLGAGPENMQNMIGQFFPYTVKDIYGWTIIPENLGNYEPESYNHHPITLAPDIIASARNNLVIRDGVASFFYHPDYPVSELRAIVEGIKAAGYTFVTPDSM